jgi:hypothetical protein
MKKSGYFEALGLTPYWFAHVIANVVAEPRAYLRNLHDILSEDGRATELCNAFPRWSNLHQFISDIFESIIHEPTDDGRATLRKFLELIKAPEDWFADIDEDGPGEITLTEVYASGRNRMVEEVFHILFRDIAFLARFNELVASFISDYAEDLELEDGRFTKFGRLRRVYVPSVIRDAIYFRDQGECRNCKKDIDRTLSPEARERYDHIVPLAKGGANDVSNIQLLCENCNSSKGAKAIAVSKLYYRSYPLDN